MASSPKAQWSQARIAMAILVLLASVLLLIQADSVLAAPRTLEETQQQKQIFKQRNQVYEAAKQALEAGKFVEALPLLEETLELTRRIRGPNHEDILRLLEALVLTHVKLDDMAAAVETQRKLVEIKLSDYEKGTWRYFDLLWSVRHMEILSELSQEQRDALMRTSEITKEAEAAQAKGDIVTAEKKIREVFETRKSLLPMPHPLKFVSLTSLGTIHLDRGESEKAADYFQQAVDLCEALYTKEECPQGHVNLATSYVYLGRALAAQDQLAEGRALLERALEMRKHLFPEDQFPDGHIHMVTNLDVLVGIAASQGDLDSERSYQEQSLAAHQRLFNKENYPEGHPFLVTSLNNMGQLHLNREELEDAEKRYKQAIEVCKQLFSKDKHPHGNPRYADSLLGLGMVYFEKGDFIRAEKLFKPAAVMYSKQRPLDFDRFATSLDYLGSAIYEQSRYQESGTYFEKTLVVYERLYPEQRYPRGHTDLLRTLLRLVQVQSHLGNDEALQQYLGRAFEIAQRLYPEEEFPHGHPDLGAIYEEMGTRMIEIQPAKARQYYEQALSIYEHAYQTEEYPQGHVSLAVVLMHLGLVNENLGDLESAQAFNRRAEVMYEQLFPTDQYPKGNNLLAVVYSSIASVLSRQGDYEAAEEYYKRGYEMRLRLYPPEEYPEGHSETAKSLSNMGRIHEDQAEYEEAIDYFKQAIKAWDNLYPIEKYPNGNYRLALALQDLGRVFHLQGDYASAFPFQKRALVMFQRLYPRDQFPQGHPNLASCLNEMGLSLDLQGQHEDAKHHFQQALDILDALHPEGGNGLQAVVVRNLGNATARSGDTVASHELLIRAVRLREMLLPAGDDSLGSIELADCLYDLGLVRERAQDYPAAAEALNRAVAMYTSLVPQWTMYHVNCLLGLIRCSAAMGDHSESLSRLDQVHAVLHELFPPEEYPDGHAEIAANLDRYGEYFVVQKDYLAALSQHERALYMRNQLYTAEQYPKGHEQLITSYTHLGTLLYNLGDYVNAGECFQQIYLMHEKLYPPAIHPRGKPNLILDLNRLGAMLVTVGDLPSAFELYSHSLALHQELFDPENYPNGHPDIATTLNNLGDLSLQMGEYRRAQQCYEQALVQWEFFCSPDRYPAGHPYLAVTYSSLGYVLHALGDSEGAEDYCNRALEMFEKLYPSQKYPKGTLHEAQCLNSLGLLNRSRGNHLESRIFFEQALAILTQRANSQSRQVQVARTLNNLVRLHFQTGDYDKAKEFSRKSLDLYEQCYPTEWFPLGHQELAMSLRNLAELEIAGGTTTSGYNQLSDAFWMQLQDARDVISVATERECRTRSRALRGPHDALLTLSWLYRKHVPEATANAFQACVACKTLPFDGSQRIRFRYELELTDSDFADRMWRYRALRQQFVELVDAPMVEETMESRYDDLRQPANAVHQLHDDLEASVNAAAHYSPKLKIDPKVLAKHLAANSAVVEFVRMTPYVFKAEGDQSPWRHPRYLAFVLTAQSTEPQLVDLGTAEPIDQAIAAVRNHMLDSSLRIDPDSANSLEAEYQQHAKALSALVFAPLYTALGDARTVYLSPDAQLNHIDFGALVDDSGKYLIENYQFSYVSSSRDLFRHHGQISDGTVVFTSPDFDSAGSWETEEPTVTDADNAATEEQLQAGVEGTSTKPDMKWEAIPTADSQTVISESLRSSADFSEVEHRDSGKASEAEFRSLASAAILHLSTYAFEMENPGAIFDLQPLIDWGEGARFAPGEWKSRGAPYTVTHYLGRLGDQIDPHQRVGIVLAGANRANPKDRVLQDPDDGLLTADEIGTLDLSQTRLVVFESADTKSGTALTAECISTLRYAFLQSGSQMFLTNLFNTSAAANQKFLSEFYQRLATGSNTTLEAVAAAKRAIINECRDTKGAAHPLHWAGFVLSGVESTE